MPAENNDSISVAESNEVLAEKAIREGLLYHGSPNHYAVLKPQTQEDVSGKKVLSFSPFKSIASMFVIPVDRLIRGYHRCRLRYDEWFNMSKDKYQPLTTVHVYHNIKQMGDFEKVFSGYLYTVKAEDVLQNATDNPKWRGEKEVLAYASEIHPVKTEQISVKVVFKYDLKRCGTDYDAVPSGTSEEAIKDSVSSNIKNNLVYSEVEIKRKGEGSVEEYYYGMNPEDYIPDDDPMDELKKKAMGHPVDASTEDLFLDNVSMEENVVQEQGTYVLIRGFPVAAFFKQLSKHYQTHKLENLIHVVHSIGIAQWTVNTRTVKIHRFFLPEIVYLLTKFNMSQTLIGDIKRGSWMGAPITEHTRCDVSRISANMTCTLMPHQQKFVEEYADLKDYHRLRGYLLSFGQGLGKTITAIALMEALNKERVIVICPKNTMVETWKSHFQRFYKKEQSVYVAGVDKEFTGQRFCVFNYDAISKINDTPGLKTSNLGIIVDECHNFLRQQAQRTQLLIKLIKSGIASDVLLISGTPIKGGN